MKRYGNIFEKIYDYNNLKLAHKYARRGKLFYKEVQYVDAHEEECLINIQNMLIWKTYQTSKYEKFIKKERGKEREIYKLPYYPDRIVHWAIMLQIEDIFNEVFTNFSHASIKGRGIHSAYKQVIKYMRDKESTKYCLKLDVKKFFPNINHDILKSLIRKKIKDDDLLWLLDEIIDSVDGVPIGNYLSQYFANYYLSYFDHWLKEEMKVKYVIRYMDDIVIFHKDKSVLNKLKIEIENYLKDNLKLQLKSNWQVFPTRIRGLDFIGYRFFDNYILLRKSTCKNLKIKTRNILKQCKNGKQLNLSKWCAINSYAGWIKWCNGFNLNKKYIYPLKPYSEKYYKEVIKSESKKHS